jgi:hypothetical protein
VFLHFAFVFGYDIIKIKCILIASP